MAQIGLGTTGGFEVGGPSQGHYANKYMPSVSDIVAKNWGTHTLKAGVFWEYIRNYQAAGNNTNGQLGFNIANSNTSGNPYADMLLGVINAYSETNFNRINDISYTSLEGFAQDSWKVTRRLTVELGIRITHFTPWKDDLGYGYSIFDYSKYNSSCKTTDYCGFVWHSRDPSVPLSGFPSRLAFYQPRFGVAYDLFGTGKTVLRGGWGRYYYHSDMFITGLNVSAGMQNVSLGANQGTGGNSPLLASELDTLPFSVAALSTGAVDKTDDRNPGTDSYSFTISQRAPGSAIVELAYVGNQTRNIANATGAGSNINLVPVGAMLSSNNGGKDPGTLTANNFRPMLGFGNVNLATNNLYSNYNGLQMRYMRTKGRAMINLNYTFSKALGIVDAALDSFNLNNDYGVQPTNRTHIFNAAYSYDFGRVVRKRWAGAFVNDWQISGITRLQSGVNLTGQSDQTFNLALNSAKIPGTTFNISTTSLLGTPDITLSPIVTCDPAANLGPHQYINKNCFAFPNQIGQNGPTTLPVIYGPAYFNSDLGIFKNFKFKEQRKLQLRINAYNFLNHPLWSFSGSNLNLGFAGATGLVNTPLFGTVTSKQGHRIVQLAANFYF